VRPVALQDRATYVATNTHGKLGPNTPRARKSARQRPKCPYGAQSKKLGSQSRRTMETRQNFENLYHALAHALGSPDISDGATS
jgi:hypothetical protein